MPARPPAGVRRALAVCSVCFALLPAVAAAQTGAIGGTVAASGTSSPLENVQVIAVDAAGNFVRSAISGPTGAYLIQLLPPGNYYLYSYTDQPYVDEIYDDIPCLVLCLGSSAAARGAVIAVSSGGVAANRNFALAPAARISGTVTRSAGGAPIAGVMVSAVTATGVAAGDGSTTVSGAYEITKLPAGTYFLYSSNGVGFLNQVYDGVACVSFCSGAAAAAQGAPVAVAEGGLASARNFALAHGGRITGAVTSAGMPIPSVLMMAVNSAGYQFTGTTNASGVYEIAALPASTYRVFTVTADAAGYLNEIYADVPCPVRCVTAEAGAAGAPVAVTVEATASGIDFSLAAGGRITGTVTNAATGVPLAGIAVQVVSSTPSTIHLANPVATNASGAFTLTGLPPGAYHAYTMNSAGYINEIFGDIACVGDCFEAQAIVGTPILVGAGTTTAGVNIALAPGGRISGTVTDGATAGGIQSAFVFVYNPQNQVVARGISDGAGAYITTPGLPAGTYYAVVSSGGYLCEIFDDVACGTSCFSMVTTAGTPIVVAAGATSAGRNFVLDRGGRVRGTIRLDGTGQPIAGAIVNIFNEAGRFVSGGVSDQDGLYTSQIGLPGGVYFASTSNFAGYRNEIFDNRPCTDNCITQVTTGTPINVTAGVVSLVDVALARATGPPDAPSSLRSGNLAGGVLISWNEPLGAPATSYRLEAGFAPGATALSIPVAGTSYLAAGVPPGVYFLRVRGVNAAGAGPASAEIVIGVGAGGVVAPGPPRFLFATMTGSRLLLSWDEASDGGAPVDFVVEAGSATGLANIALVAVNRRAFTYDPVPNGFYFLRVRARNPAGISAPSNEVMLVVGAVPSPPGQVQRLGASVSGSTVTLSWLPPPGPVTGYIVEAGSAPGLSNLAVAPLGAGGSAVFTGVPRGKYYVRIRAVNGLGRGIASAETTVIVE